MQEVNEPLEYPYNDDYMVFDETTNRYELTVKCITDKLGFTSYLDEINDRNGNAQILAKMYLKRLSAVIYGYIHDNSHNTSLQDWYIAKVPTLRSIIQNALEFQFIFFVMKGDLTMSLDKGEKSQAVDLLAKQELERVVPEIGCSILYGGF